MGLFLGVALFHLPGLFGALFNWSKKFRCLSINPKRCLNHKVDSIRPLMEIAVKVFYGLCILSTLIMTSWCFYLYASNDDTSQVDYILFNENKNSIYPSVSLCLEEPFPSTEFIGFYNKSTDQVINSYITNINETGNKLTLTTCNYTTLHSKVYRKHILPLFYIIAHLSTYSLY